MTDDTADKEKNKKKGLRVYVRPQNVCDYFIATMDPKDPLKICLYPSVKNAGNTQLGNLDNDPEELEDLLLHNYLNFKRYCRKDE